MKQKQHLVITLPESLADLPIRIIRDSDCEELDLNLLPLDTETEIRCTDPPEKKHAFIWRQHDYAKVALDEIQWIEADKSYSIVHLTDQREMVISFNLAVVRESLPKTSFVQIHRSYVVNLKHIDGLTGNCAKVGKALVPIGREYRHAFLDRFIFLGVRRSKFKL